MSGLISNGTYVLGDPNTRDLYVKTPLTTGFEGDKYYIGLDDELLKVLTVTYTPASDGASVNTTADIPEGYKFVHWIGASTNGYSQSYYAVNYDSSTTTWFMGGKFNAWSSGKTIRFSYLVMKE